MLGYSAFGPAKDAFYNLLCARSAFKGEALFEALRQIITKMNTLLPGSERLCVTTPMQCA